MGYSHYWSYKGETNTKSFASNMQKINKLVDMIVKSSDVSVCYDYDYPHIPIQNAPYGIRFNGLENYHETFMFTLYDHEGFCKTNRKPYDIVVCAVLFAMESVFPKSKFTWGSDGFGDNCYEWEMEEAYNLFVQATGYEGVNLLTRRTK